MTEYIIKMDTAPNRDCYAEHEQFGGAVILYMEEINLALSDLSMHGTIKEDYIIALTKAVLVHEDLHVAISECVDTSGMQEHDTVFEWIADAIDRTT